MARILIVEDEPRLARGLQDDLELEGYVVELVGDGVEATRRARDAPFDLIILDVMLPRKDGFEVCRELRRAGIRTPIIMLTARTGEADKILGFDVGADDYVTKPFGPRELRARIKAVLRRTGDDTPEICRFGNVEVDFEWEKGSGVFCSYCHELMAEIEKYSRPLFPFRAQFLPSASMGSIRDARNAGREAASVATPTSSAAAPM
jgi:CheY-like chemotaxis protein